MREALYCKQVKFIGICIGHKAILDWPCHVLSLFELQDVPPGFRRCGFGEAAPVLQERAVDLRQHPPQRPAHRPRNVQRRRHQELRRGRQLLNQSLCHNDGRWSELIGSLELGNVGFYYSWFFVLVGLWISWTKSLTLPFLRLAMILPQGEVFGKCYEYGRARGP